MIAESKKNQIAEKIEKISVNSGIGRLTTQPGFNDKLLEELIKDFALITGQRPRTRAAKQSISGFKLRQGAVVGFNATLRGKRMADFFLKVIKAVLPRIRDFRGLDPKKIDQGGNLNIGIKENIVFPEINPEVTKVNFGLQITVVPKKVKNREAAIRVYKELGIPFKK